MTETPLISVVVNCLNGEKFLRDCLESIRSQTYENVEVIFVDNASIDGSSRILQDFSLRIKYVRLCKTIPLYAARNVALRSVNGEFVAFIDTDDVWEDNKLEKQIRLFDGQTVLAYSKRIRIGERGEVLSERDSRKFENNVVNRMLLKSFIPMSSVILRSDVAKELSFDGRFNLLGDFDMWVRAAMRGKVRFVDEVLLRDRIHSTNTGYVERDDWIVERRLFYREFIHRYRFKYPAILAFVLRVEIGGVLTKFFR